MKKLLQNISLALCALTLGISSTSCSDDDSNDSSSDGLDSKTGQIIKTYVDGVVVPTYQSLADESINLYAAVVALKADPTQANVQKACDEWISARKYWEQSEAFLYGAAADYNIDPHIDSWPLDKDQLDLLLQNDATMKQMDENGCNFDGFATLGYGLLGFHAVEYVLFRDGQARTVSDISTKELAFCAAVAEDLRNQTIRLEASWNGLENVSAAKQQILANAELEPSINYGQLLENAGEEGNTKYKTQKAAIEEIIKGASDISDEVGNTKITDPVESGNVLDVESWYSWNSIADFADNMRSVQHAYNGNLTATANSLSVSAYIHLIDSDLDSKIQAAIANAITEIEAMPAPFRNHLTTAETDKAKAACQTVVDLLDEAANKVNE